MRSRLLAALVLALAAFTVVAAVYSAFANFPRGLIVAALVIFAASAAWWGLLRTDSRRVVGLVAAAVLALAAVVIVIVDSGVFELVVIAVAALATFAATKALFSIHASLPGAADPARPVLFYNPKSGGGKAERFKLADEARARGIEPIELGPPWDLEQLVRDAIAGGADALAMAGGDGSQAIVAAIAAEHGLPYACIPAGTRNHFALDLGVDRDDVVGALEAFRDGGERRVDLAEVNGRVFVNNVSLGLYADAVQREGYREAKLRTILGTLPEVLGPDGGRARSALDRAQRERAFRRCRHPRVEQPLPARQGGRLRHPPADRRRPARDHRGRCAPGTRRGTTAPSAAVA